MQYSGSYGGGSTVPSENPGQEQGGFGSPFGTGIDGGFGGNPGADGSGWGPAGGQSDASWPGGFADTQGGGPAAFGSNPSGFNANPFSGEAEGFSSGGPFSDNPAGPASWDSGPGNPSSDMNIGEPSSAWNVPAGGGSNPSARRGIPKPVIILLIVLAVLLFLFGGVLIADHTGVIRIPFLHSEDSEPEPAPGPAPGDHGGETAEPAVEEQTGFTAEEEEPEEPLQPQPSPGNTDPADLGTLSMTVTEVEPSELGEYRTVSVKKVEAASGVDGTDPENLIRRDESVWKVTKTTVLSAEGNTIHLSFDKCSVKVVEVRAGNWAGAEEYNADARPTKIYLSMEGYDYPLTLTDEQTPHYIVLSRPVETDELNLKVDSISNGTTGYAAITNITVYETDN